jgi:hypothetical protein
MEIEYLEFDDTPEVGPGVRAAVRGVGVVYLTGIEHAIAAAAQFKAQAEAEPLGGRLPILREARVRWLPR